MHNFDGVCMMKFIAIHTIMLTWCWCESVCVMVGVGLMEFYPLLGTQRIISSSDRENKVGVKMQRKQ